MQQLPLERKIEMTAERIDAWYQHYDGNVAVSFSGGKDSTVLNLATLEKLAHQYHIRWDEDIFNDDIENDL